MEFERGKEERKSKIDFNNQKVRRGGTVIFLVLSYQKVSSYFGANCAFDSEEIRANE